VEHEKVREPRNFSNSVQVMCSVVQHMPQRLPCQHKFSGWDLILRPHMPKLEYH